MNNFGMNPMGMNPMQMNNMGMMGMNNQPNLMDQTALNIKNIIQPYENKIRELEEIIKQKDFEILVLKQKLNNKSSNINFMNMNPMMNMPFLNNDNEISITVQSNIKLKKNDKASVLEYYSQFTHDYMPILFDKTFEENGIKNGSIINITDKIYNLTFKYNNYSTTISLDGNCPFKQAIYFYCQRNTDNNIYQKISNDTIQFVRNQIKLNIKDETPLKIFFGNDGMNPSILVLDQGNIIGG